MKEFVEYFDKVVDCFEIGQVVVIEVNTDTEIKASIATIHYLKITELYDMCVCVCVCVWRGEGYRGTIKKKNECAQNRHLRRQSLCVLHP